MPFGISFDHRGDFKKTEQFFRRLLHRDYLKILDRYGQLGVLELAANTPKDTGLTASSWTYDIELGGQRSSLIFSNSNIQNGVNIAIILQYGHGTKNGGYVQGRDYINPAIRPILDKIAEEAWREVQSL